MFCVLLCDCGKNKNKWKQRGRGTAMFNCVLCAFQCCIWPVPHLWSKCLTYWPTYKRHLQSICYIYIYRLMYMTRVPKRCIIEFWINLSFVSCCYFGCFVRTLFHCVGCHCHQGSRLNHRNRKCENKMVSFLSWIYAWCYHVVFGLQQRAVWWGKTNEGWTDQDDLDVVCLSLSLFSSFSALQLGSSASSVVVSRGSVYA